MLKLRVDRHIKGYKNITVVIIITMVQIKVNCKNANEAFKATVRHY